MERKPDSNQNSLQSKQQEKHLLMYVTNNLFLKICAVALAILLWAGVQASSDPSVEEKLTIPIEYINEQYLDQNDCYLKDYPETITIKVKAKVSAHLNLIKKERFRAVADLSARLGEDPTRQLVQVVVTPDEEIVNSIQDMSFKTSDWVSIVLEPIQTKEFPVEVILEGELPEGYQLSQDGFTLDPEVITLRAPESRFSSINKVVVTVPLDHVTGEVINQTIKPTLLDANNKVVAMEKCMSFHVDTVSVETELLRSKKIPVVLEGISGVPEEGYRCKGSRVNPTEISVIGTVADLAEITNVMIPKEVTNIDKATMDFEIVVDITKYLPENIMLYGNDSVVQVMISIEELDERNYRIPVEQIELIGVKEGLKYEFIGKSFVVTLMGLEEDLNSLGEEEIQLTADVSQLSLGMNSGVPIQVQVRSGFIIKKAPTVSMTVHEVAEQPTVEEPETSEEVVDESTDESTLVQ